MDFLTVNLESKLIESKRKTIKKINKQSNDSQLILNQVQSILENDSENDLNLLKDIGFGGAIESANDIQKLHDKQKSVSKNILNERIFTLEEIKTIAINYGLRFLPTRYYKGSLPNELPLKIKEFENLGFDLGLNEDSMSIAESWSLSDYLRNGDSTSASKKYSYFILAPKESFNLQPRPKDPLLFAMLSDGTYYLVHKWGDDLSIWNYIKNLGKRNTKLHFGIIFISILLLVFFTLTLIGYKNTFFTTAGMSVAFFALIIIGAAGGFDTKQNDKNWDNPYSD